MKPLLVVSPLERRDETLKRSLRTGIFKEEAWEEFWA
jgi:hypothetical protein